MKKELVREYSGEEILNIDEDSYVPLVEGIVYKNDFVVMPGKYKSKKTIFSMQLACSVSSGVDLFDEYHVPESHRVWYFSTEGKDNEMKDRFKRMSAKVPTRLDNIRLFCSTQFKFNTEMGINFIDEVVERYKDELPQLIVIDSLYSGYKGSLTNDDMANEYITAVRYLAEMCGDSAIWITHHYKKQLRNSEGKEIVQGSEDSFGSVFLLGQADHIFTIERFNKSNHQTLVKCDVERSGKIVDEIHLHFHEPDPLFFSMGDVHEKEMKKVVKLLSGCDGGMGAFEIFKKIGVKKSLGYRILNKLEKRKIIEKEKSYGGKYMVTTKIGDVASQSPLL